MTAVNLPAFAGYAAKTSSVTHDLPTRDIGTGTGVTGAGITIGTVIGGEAVGDLIAEAGTACLVPVSIRFENHFAKKASINSLNFCGASRNTRCPVFGITSACALGILAASALASSAFWPIFGRNASGALGRPGAL